MTINKINGELCKKARSLWEEVFSEDSVQFTDYYFENKAEKNIGYVIGQAPFDAMMFRTPYQLQIGQARKEISYIVGVATRKECRHKGYMRALLNYAIREMYQEKNPFTFLMPANPAIYEPFDFEYVYERDVWEVKEPERMVPFLEELTSGIKITENEKIISTESIVRKRKLELGNKNEKDEIVRKRELELRNKNEKDDYELTEAEAELCNCAEGKSLWESEQAKSESGLKKLTGLYSVRNLRRQFPKFPIMNLLAEFANDYLREHYNIYVYREASYYEMQLKESEAQNGDIYVLFDTGMMKAFFVYAKEGEEIFIQEVLEAEEGVLDFLQKSEKKKPIIMARIIHLEEMLKLVCSRENISTTIEIKDELIPENAGVYQWEITPQGSKVQKVLQAANWLDTKNTETKNTETDKSRLAEVSMQIRELAVKILSRVFINEIV